MKIFVLAVLALVLNVSVQAEETATGWQKIATYETWAKHCNRPVDAPEQCRIFQTASQNDQLVFQASIGYLPGTDSAIMFMTGPLGIFLPKGVSLIAGEGEGEAITAGFLHCNAQGCHTRFAIEEVMVSRLKAAADAQIVFWANNEQNVILPLDLKGFTRAINSLDKP